MRFIPFKGQVDSPSLRARGGWPDSSIMFIWSQIGDRSEVRKWLVHSRTWISLLFFCGIIKYGDSTTSRKYSVPRAHIFWLYHASIFTPHTVSGRIFTWTWDFRFFFKIILLVYTNREEDLESNLFAFDDFHLLIQYFPSGLMLFTES